ncbi:MAG: hypothetical protein ACRECD_14015 [Burkholderiaceae bacterium]
MTATPKTISGAEFKLHFGPLLASLKDDDQVSFGNGDLSLFKPRERGPSNGPRLVNIEFNELYVVTNGLDLP